MAVHFIHKGGYDMGYHMYIPMKEEIMIHVVHNSEDGYCLSYSREIIKEQLNLKKFIERLVRVEDFQKGFSEIQSKVERDMYVIVEALASRSSEKIKGIAEWLDHRYSNLIRDKKLVLMEHSYSVNVHQVGIHTERETISNRERITPQVGWDKKKTLEHMDEQGVYPITSNQVYKKIPKKKEITDDEVYYLTTP